MLRSSAACATLGLALLAAACAPGTRAAAECPASPTGSSVPSAASTAAVVASPDPLAEADLGVEITPVFEPPSFLVRLHVGSRVDSQSFSIQHVKEKDLLKLERVFADGHREPVAPVVVGSGLRVTLPAKQPLELEYRVRAADFSADAIELNAVNPNRVRVGGERLLLLPDEHPDQSLEVSIRIHSDNLGVPQGAASSLGVGELRSLELSSRSLRQISLVAGPLGSARFAGPEGQDETAWVGYTSFDPRLVSAQNAVFRSAIREYFGDLRSTPLTLLIVSDGRPVGDYDVARRSWSVLIHVATGQPWDGTLSLAV
ncbi:MAG: hypothetical protein KC492_08285, partial [Myxococcales bacterium]|nr:hypothetical protein [Myxococcales bacterium]